MNSRRRSGLGLVRQRDRRPGWRLLLAVVAATVEVAGTWLRSGRLGGNLVVRCAQGHLFTTIWIPAASVKSLRLGWWRLQRCPVGHHLTVVTPVKEAALSNDERRAAREHQDIRLP